MKSTRESIVRSAEVLFAENGYATTSLREITEHAGVNIASVNYHFGGKENLLIEVLDRVVAPLNAQRLEMLDEIERAGEPEVRSILTAFLLPDLNVLYELRQRDPALPQFVSRMYSESSELMNRIIGEQFVEVGVRFGEALALAVPDLSPDEVMWRMQCIVGVVIHLFSRSSELVGEDRSHELERLLAVTVPLISAPMPAEVV